MTMTELPSRPVLTSLSDPDLVTTAAAMVTWRKSFGWTQEEAGRQLGVVKRTIRRYETGVSEVPRFITLACWALRKAPHRLSLEPEEER